MPSAEGVPTAESVAVRLRAAIDAAETGGWLTTGREMTALLRDACRVIEGTAPGQEVRREWRVWVQGPGGTTVLSDELASLAHALDEARAARRYWPNDVVEIEEREITTRVVERRVVPRTTTGEGA